MKRYIIFEEKEYLIAWLKNILKFTAPALVVFFGQLASGVDLKIAGAVALLAFWGLLADYYKKLSEDTRG